MDTKNTNGKIKSIKLIIYICLIMCFIVIVRNGISTLNKVSKKYVVEEGNLRFEETTNGYVLRDETVIKGENSKNGIIQIVSEGERVSKGGQVFRYYSSDEEETLSKISSLDEEIDELLENSGITIFSNDITILEKNIKQVVSSMYEMNEIENIEDKITEINTYISKKTRIAGNLSPTDSQVKKLIEQRNELENNLTKSSEIVYAPVSGMVSYKIDGYEEKMRN